MPADVLPSLSCRLCGATDAVVDEDDRCEACVLTAEHFAADPLDSLEHFIKLAFQAEWPAERIRRAFDMSLADLRGPLSGTILGRQPVTTSERAIWTTSPPSTFIEETGSTRIERLRHCTGLSREHLADLIGYSRAEIALWEQGVMPPDEAVARLAKMFGVGCAYVREETPPYVQRPDYEDDDGDWEDDA
jgi:DNA-binding transcriptional regulator YiaG